MPDQEMIERVAVAIASRYTTDEFAMARVAIQAMREPTEKMKKAMNEAADWADGESAWYATIDCILND